jgi:hypothetical protein
VGDSAKTAATAGLKHSERLYVTWWGWPLPLLGAVLLAAEIHLGYAAVPVWLPYVIAVPVAVALLLSLGRSRIRITGGDEPELWVGDAHLPLKFAGDIEIFDKNAKRTVLGRDGDPAAYVLHRGWVGPVVRVTLTDPADPTPYWLFSTRHPERVAALLRGGA